MFFAFFAFARHTYITELLFANAIGSVTPFTHWGYYLEWYYEFISYFLQYFWKLLPLQLNMKNPMLPLVPCQIPRLVRSLHRRLVYLRKTMWWRSF